MFDHLTKVFVLIVIVLAYTRLYFGVEITDEAYYVACAYLTSIGGRPFTNDLYFQQNASMIYEPLVFLYHWAFGSTGLILFVRHLYFALALGCASSFYFLFRRFLKSESALLIALLPVTFVPYTLPTLGYNTLGSLFCGLGCAFFLMGFLDRSFKKSLLGGAFFALSMFAYPSFGIAGVLLGFIFLGREWLKNRKIVWPTIAAGAFWLFLFLGFWGSNVLRFGFENLKLSYDITVAYGALGSGLNKVLTFYNLMQEFGPPLWAVLLILVLALIAQKAFNISWLWAMTILAGYFVINIEKPAHLANVLVTFTALIGLPGLALLKNKNSEEQKIGFSLLAVTFVLAMAVGWTSSMTLYATSLGAQFALMALFFLYANRSDRATILISLVIFHSLLLSWSYTYVYREDNIPLLSEAITQGPYAGIFTTPEKAQLMEQIRQDVAANQKGAKSILFYDSFPAGYFFSDLPPAAPSVFIHPLPYGNVMRDYYAAYYSEPKNWPDLFFQFESFPFSLNSPDQFRNQYTFPPTDKFFDLLPNTGAYDLVATRKNYKIWKKKN